MANYVMNAIPISCVTGDDLAKCVVCLTIDPPNFSPATKCHIPWGDVNHRAPFAAPTIGEIHCAHSELDRLGICAPEDVVIACANGHNRSYFLSALLNFQKIASSPLVDPVQFVSKFVSAARTSVPAAFGFESVDNHKSPAFVYRLVTVLTRLLETPPVPPLLFRFVTLGAESGVPPPSLHQEATDGVSVFRGWPEETSTHFHVAVGLSSEDLTGIWNRLPPGALLVSLSPIDTRLRLAALDPNCGRPYEDRRKFRCQQQKDLKWLLSYGDAELLVTPSAGWRPSDSTFVLPENWREAYVKYASRPDKDSFFGVPLYGAEQTVVWMFEARSFIKGTAQGKAQALLSTPPPLPDSAARQFCRALFACDVQEPPFEMTVGRHTLTTDASVGGEYVLLSFDVDSHGRDLQASAKFVQPIAADRWSLAEAQKALKGRGETLYRLHTTPSTPEGAIVLVFFWFRKVFEDCTFCDAARGTRGVLDGRWFRSNELSYMETAEFICDAHGLPPEILAEPDARVAAGDALRILDVGCGHGQAVQSGLKGIRGTIYCVDPCPTQIRVCRSRCSTACGRDFLFFQNDVAGFANNRSRDDEPFDLVLCSMSGHHMETGDIRDIAEMTREGGHLVISAPNGQRIVALADAAGHWGDGWLRALPGCKSLRIDVHGDQVVFAADDVTKNGSSEPLCFLGRLERQLYEAGFCAIDYRPERRNGAFRDNADSGIARLFSTGVFRLEARCADGGARQERTPIKHDAELCLYCRNHERRERFRVPPTNVTHKRENRTAFNEAIKIALQPEASHVNFANLPRTFRCLESAPLRHGPELIRKVFDTVPWMARLRDTRRLPALMPVVLNGNWLHLLTDGSKSGQEIIVASKDDGYRVLLLLRKDRRPVLFDRSFAAYYPPTGWNYPNCDAVLDGEFLSGDTELDPVFLWHTVLHGSGADDALPHVRRKQFYQLSSVESPAKIMELCRVANTRVPPDGLVYRMPSRCSVTIKDKFSHTIDLFFRTDGYLFAKNGEFVGVASNPDPKWVGLAVECRPLQHAFPRRFEVIGAKDAPEKPPGILGANALQTVISSLAADAAGTQTDRFELIRAGLAHVPTATRSLYRVHFNDEKIMRLVLSWVSVKPAEEAARTKFILHLYRTTHSGRRADKALGSNFGTKIEESFLEFSKGT